MVLDDRGDLVGRLGLVGEVQLLDPAIEAGREIPSSSAARDLFCRALRSAFSISRRSTWVSSSSSGVIGGGSGGRDVGGAEVAPDLGREVVGLDPVARARRVGRVDDPGQLAEVARPVVGEQRRRAPRAEPAPLAVAAEVRAVPGGAGPGAAARRAGRGAGGGGSPGSSARSRGRGGAARPGARRRGRRPSWRSGGRAASSGAASRPCRSRGRSRMSPIRRVEPSGRVSRGAAPSSPATRELAYPGSRRAGPRSRRGGAGRLSEAIGLGPATVAEPASKPAATGFRLWMLIPAAAILAVAAWFTPLRQRLVSSSAIPVAGSNAHADYLKAQNLLDHYYQLHKTEAAIDLFRKTIEEDPRFALAYAGLGRAYFIQFRNGQDPALIQKIQDACAKALALDRDLASAHVTLGMLYTLTTQNDLAAQELQEAASLDANNAEVWGAWADLYNRQGRAKDVEPAYQKAADLAPMDWRWPNQLGVYYDDSGRTEDAVRSYHQALKIADDNALLWNNLGVAYGIRTSLSTPKLLFVRPSISSRGTSSFPI